MVIVLICVVALPIELVVSARSNGDLATVSARAGIVTSLVCSIAGAAGLRHSSLAIPELGLVLGILGLVLSVGLEAVSRACFVCF